MPGKAVEDRGARRCAERRAWVVREPTQLGGGAVRVLEGGSATFDNVQFVNNRALGVSASLPTATQPFAPCFPACRAHPLAASTTS